MFDTLTQRLTAIFDRLRGYGRLTEENIQEALREVRVALLEADVNFKVVKAFVERVRAKAVGQDVLQSLTPGQQVVKGVHDEPMLEELQMLKREVHPHHVLLVADAMTGQDAVTMAERFNSAVGIDAVIMAKLDGDARGGAALSIRQVIGRPIAFVGTGEKPDALEPFHPARMASRILGMGDVVSLVEKGQAGVDHAKAEELARKIREESFTLEDFADQLKQPPPL